MSESDELIKKLEEELNSLEDKESKESKILELKKKIRTIKDKNDPVKKTLSKVWGFTKKGLKEINKANKKNAERLFSDKKGGLL